jgi:hypothetical protein
VKRFLKWAIESIIRIRRDQIQLLTTFDDEERKFQKEIISGEKSWIGFLFSKIAKLREKVMQRD